MKKIIYYIITMIIVIMIIPMFIVKSCSFASFRTKGSKNIEREHKNTDQIQDSSKGESEYKGDTTKIRVYTQSEDVIQEMWLEEYITGVVAAEMPAEFAIEALKAQAVAARTYAYGRLKGMYKNKNDTHAYADVCTDFSHCQAWISKDEAFERWGEPSAKDYWNKIKKAVEETKGVIILYQGIIANPVFHSNSGGRTENAEDVWDIDSVDYLKSVVSKGEEISPSFVSVLEIQVKDACNILKENYPDIQINQNNIFDDIKVLGRTQGGRVETVKVGSIEIKGTDFRKVFSLPSANFELNQNSRGLLEIRTCGSGHGVGMSQWGANSMAKDGKAWDDIVKYYYKGVELDTIINIENNLAGL